MQVEQDMLHTAEPLDPQAPLPLIEAIFDGSCEPKNPGGHASFGSIVRVDGVIVYQHSGYCGYGPKMSNNVAEYAGAIDALKEASKYPGTIMLQGDSRMVLMQLGPDPSLGETRWKAKRGLYLPYYREAMVLVRRLEDRLCCKWVPRLQNTECDALSKLALFDRGIKSCVRRRATGSFRRKVVPRSGIRGRKRQGKHRHRKTWHRRRRIKAVNHSGLYCPNTASLPLDVSWFACH